MSDSPWLPLSPRQTGSLLKTLDAVLPDAPTEAERRLPIGPIVERMVVTLVRTLRTEEPDADETQKSSRKGARRRALRAGMMTGGP